jgi:hypothetical protein
MKRWMNKQTISVCVLVACMMGCDVELASSSQTLSGAMTRRKQWTISGSGAEFINLKAALDENPRTMARTKTSKFSDASITIDLGQSCVFNLVILYHGDEPLGFPKQVSVSTSSDGVTFEQQAIVPGTRKVTYILLEHWKRSRYVRITADRAAQRKPWCLSELYVR